MKICGLTSEADAGLLIKYGADYGGVVVFYPKSKRDVTIKEAKIIVDILKKSDIKAVAVTVSPTVEQLYKIQEAGFDYIQIHGTVTEDVYKQCKLPILRAFNVSDLDKLNEYEAKDKIKGYVFDSKTPGSGKTFDWSLLDNIRQRQKTDVSKDVSHKKNKKMIFLAGGIDETNVKRAISQVAPDVIDLSSAVEKTSEDGTFHGKDPEKIRTIVTMVHD